MNEPENTKPNGESQFAAARGLGQQKTTSEYAAEALALLDAMTPEQKRKCAKSISSGYNAEMKRVNRRA